VNIYAFGAYGTNNIGDEAIFQGIKRAYPGVRMIYVNKSNEPNSIWYADFTERRHNFTPGSHLIIGGGGLLYGRDAVETMLQLVALCRGSGGTISVEGLGCEALKEDYVDLVKQLMSQANKITVRSKSSQAILAEIGVQSEVVEDFAFQLRDLFQHPPRERGEMPRIGLALSGDAYNQNYAKLCELIERYTVGDKRMEFIHIPHSHSYVDRFNNDLIVGQHIWSSIAVYHAKREERFTCLPYVNDVAAVAKEYGKIDAVIAERFHGIVFGVMSGIPIVANAHNRKNRAVIEDLGDKADFIPFEGDDGLEAAFERMWEKVSQR